MMDTYRSQEYIRSEKRFMRDIPFTEEERELIYHALLCYGNHLHQISKTISEEIILNPLIDRAKDSWILARKITERR